jgi:hypothetical protein
MNDRMIFPIHRVYCIEKRLDGKMRMVVVNVQNAPLSRFLIILQIRAWGSQFLLSPS